MPTISSFYGILIQMHWDEHLPPHFHALYAEHEVLIEISTLKTYRGSLPGRAMRLVLEWAEEHRAELQQNWDLCANAQSPRKISPLA